MVEVEKEMNENDSILRAMKYVRHLFHNPDLEERGNLVTDIEMLTILNKTFVYSKVTKQLIARDIRFLAKILNAYEIGDPRL